MKAQRNLSKEELGAQAGLQCLSLINSESSWTTFETDMDLPVSNAWVKLPVIHTTT